MKITAQGGWVFYLSDNCSSLEEHKSGKWMYYFSDRSVVEKICQTAVETGIVVEAKHSDSSHGVSCFYLNIDDNDGHKKVLNFFLKNKMVKKTKTGKLYNISFKLDDQTRAGEYGDNFTAELKLDHFLNLETGEWKV